MPRTPGRYLTRPPRVQTIHVERGDVVVVEVPDHLTTDAKADLHRVCKRVWRRNQVLILDGGAVLKLGTKTK